MAEGRLLGQGGAVRIRLAWDGAVRLFGGISQEAGRQGERGEDAPAARLGSRFIASRSWVGFREEAY